MSKELLRELNNSKEKSQFEVGAQTEIQGAYLGSEP